MPTTAKYCSFASRVYVVAARFLLSYGFPAAGPGGGSLLYTDLAFTKAAPNWNAFLTGGPP